MKYTKCTKCNNIISNNNYKKHQESCNGNYIKFIKSDRCQHCHKTWEELGLNMIKGDNGNHSLWCEKNPRKNEYKENIKKIKYTGDQIKKRNKSIEEAWKNRVIWLENQVIRMMQEQACAKDKHEWEMTNSAFHDKPPFVRCKHCYTCPLSQSKGGSE